MAQPAASEPVALSEWQPIVSGNAELKLSTVLAGRAPALRLEYDFKGGKGFVVARRQFSRQMPAEYAVHFRLRGRGGVNNLELKLIDPSGRNVWRHVEKDLNLPARWKRVRVESRDIEFGWGPASGSSISQLGSLEFAIVAGEGGAGAVWIADLEIEDCTPVQSPIASASSALPQFEATQALAGTGWRPRPDDLKPWITVDCIQARTFGGLVIDWLDDAPPSGFRIRGSSTGHRWKTLHTARRAGGKRSYLYLPGLKTRFLRLEINEPTAGAALRPQSFEFSRSIHAFWHHIAAAEPRGWHPRWLHREQSVWTPTGTAHGMHCALMNADGMVEVDQGSYSIEPMLRIGERLVTWADVASRQTLLDDWMPVPSVTWETGEWRLRIEAQGTVSGACRLRYRFENLTDRAMTVHLFAVVRPFQVTPPWQNFRNLGGVSPIRDLAWRDGAVHVNEALTIVPMGEPAGFGAITFDEGFIASALLAGRLPEDAQVHDPFGFASGALLFDLSLRPREHGERVLNCMPLAATRSAAEPVFDWRPRLAVAQWAGHGWIGEAIRAALTATAHILVTRSGPALQPGPRRYTRSWIRDGAMMSAALLRMGHLDEVREFIRWYAPHQRADGFVPCCVDQEGIDWLVEHDSHGQLLALIADYHRFTGNEEFLTESWTFVEKAARYIESVLDPEGLLPISVSHEGYLAQPVHSYWDDFWALRGLRDATDLARTIGRKEWAQRWEALAARLAVSLFRSIETTRAERKLEFIPGSIEWADFDPTATANAIYLLDVPEGLNRMAVERTFDIYLDDWHAKRNGTVPSPSYTPYEIRIIGALVRLGKRDAALELLRFFLSDRRPPPWNQWPEIAWKDQQAPAHVGDLPHTWIAAEYVLAVRSLFAYEREADHTLVLAAGLAPEWIEGSGVEVNEMPTLYGALSYALRRIAPDTVQFSIPSATTAKLKLRPPLTGPLARVTVDGKAWSDFDADSVTLLRSPADVICITS
jgi:hypothetical protein